MYSMLSGYTNLGKSPIFFSASNDSADYSSDVWMDPCYERFYEVGADYVVYWFVNDDMYCEALVRGNTETEYNPTYKLKYLARVEHKKTWCPKQV
uniref:Uncharacterized protein n=2 Tax=Caenorhabditis japonica TaxID=281687 RepID=A0A8R1I9L9_CAEJA